MKITEKRKRKEARKILTQKELDDFRASLPMEEKSFSVLFDYLEKALQECPCDHSLRHTTHFLTENKVCDIEKVTSWLTSHGGYCDCEVLCNVEEQFDYYTSNEAPLKLNKLEENILEKKKKISELPSEFDFPFSSAPAPWKLSQGSAWEARVSTSVRKRIQCLYSDAKTGFSKGETFARRLFSFSVENPYRYQNS